MFGPGLDGNRPRCAPFWDDFFACVVKNGRNEQWALCKEQREDFMECLHHKKLYTRVQKIKRQKEKLIKAGKWPPKEESA
ncbi:unnamed protein product [Pocillopora meandrina]|uniref:NADH dehydrogenase [ubiquinone] iron-sulfur protein 5 n=1 Tax=Pocillopora meandrina TaxID=46732 RepID=A0AAU9WFV3_9CNID|nr:uncharacterized protein LOC131780119 [Pocillopora verrucosa]CAH3110436.1 unnamed protein product [Pocillopora meandrina]